MKRKMFFKNIALFLPFVLLSCNNEESSPVSQEKIRVLFSVDEFEVLQQTRTNANPNNNYAITWAADDVIGIFPREGYQEPFEIPAEQVGQSKATFDGGYWALKDGLKYNAYYPFNKANFESSEMKTKIPVSYVGQEQNGTTCGIGSYDYTYSDWAIAGNRSLNFQFHHIGSFIIFSLPIPVTTTYSSLTIEANSAIIPLKGTYDLTATKPVFVADASSLSKSISITLNNFKGTTNTKATIYMMFPPVDLSAETLTLTLKAKDGGDCVYSVKGQDIVAAKLYELTGKPTASTVNGTTYDWYLNNGVLNPEGINTVVSVKNAGSLSSSALPGGSTVSGLAPLITSLKISGSLNGTDIKTLRYLSNLEALDLSEVNIVEGGNSYDGTNTTVANTFPTRFLNGSALKKLKFIALPNSITDIGYEAFTEEFSGDVPNTIYALNQIVLGEKLICINSLAFGCSIKTIHLPKNVSNVLPAAFGYCSCLESITVDANNNNFKSIDGVLYKSNGSYYPSYTLNACPTQKQSFEFPNINITKIYCRAFSDCTNLKSIIIPEGVKEIEPCAFGRCTSLESVTIPLSTTDLYLDSFYRCKSLKEIHLKYTTPPSWYIITGEDPSYPPKSCVLYVPKTDDWKYSSEKLRKWEKYFTIIYE